MIVVEDERPPAVDRELVWVLDDWRLEADGSVREDFDNRHDASHGGRLGNTATVNGRVPPDFEVRRDGHAVRPHEPPGGLVRLGPSQRVDLILDLAGQPGRRYEITDRHYARSPYKLLDLVYATGSLRAAPAGPVPVEKLVERLK